MNTKSSTKSFLYRTFAVLMIATLALAALPVTPAYAAIGAPVSIGQNQSTTSGTTLSVILGAGVAAGNTIIVAFATDTGSAGGTVSVADTGGNNYFSDADILTGNDVRTLVFSARVTTALASGNTITVTFPAADSKAMSVYYVSGLVHSAAVDQTATAVGPGAGDTAPSSGNTAATAQANELLFGAIGCECNTSNTTFTQGAGYALLNNASADTGVSQYSMTIFPEYKIVNAIGTYAADGTLDVARTWAAAIVTYKEGTATTTTLNTLSAVTYGTAVTFTANVAGATGTVHFYDGTTLLGTDTLTSGSASYTTTATQLSAIASPHSITAKYLGSATLASSTSAARSQVVNAKALTITGLTANNKVYNGNTTATLSGTAALSGGVVGSDVVTLGGTPAASFADAAVGNGKSVTVSGYTLSGAAAGNYSLTQPTGLTANITAKAITITPNAGQTKVFGASDPLPFTYTHTLHWSALIPSAARLVVRLARM